MGLCVVEVGTVKEDDLCWIPLVRTNSHQFVQTWRRASFSVL